MSGTDDPLGWVGHTVEDRIKIEEVIGEGGFALVYRGLHIGFDEPVAVKFLKLPGALSEQDRETFLSDFRAEARLLHKLSRKHLAIVQALDVGAAISPLFEFPYTSDNLGGNACGCPDPVGNCAAQSSGLAPPEPITETL